MVQFAICDDDEEYAYKFSKEFTKAYKERGTISDEIKWYVYTTGNKLIEQCEFDNIDVIFMDIEIGAESGFDIARKIYHLNVNMAVVYMTNHDNYINQAFVCRPLGFIRKNNSELDVRMALYEICQYIGKKNKKIIIKNGNNNTEILLNDVYAVEVYNHQLVFIFKKHTVSVYANLKTVEDELNAADFFRINRGRMVNPQYIKAIDKKTVYLYGGYDFVISSSRLKNVESQWLQFQSRS